MQCSSKAKSLWGIVSGETGSGHWNVQHKNHVTRATESAPMLCFICPDCCLRNTHVYCARVPSLCSHTAVHFQPSPKESQLLSDSHSACHVHMRTTTEALSLWLRPCCHDDSLFTAVTRAVFAAPLK